MATERPIRVLVVDDSALVRQVVSQALATDPGIEVIATASDPVCALEKMKARWPDVLVIDIEMPRMDGITFLKKIMAERPTPTIVCSSLAEQGAQVRVVAPEISPRLRPFVAAGRIEWLRASYRSDHLDGAVKCDQ